MLFLNLLSFLGALSFVSGQPGERADVTVLPLVLPVPMTYTAAVYDDDDSIYVIGGSISDSVKSDVIYRYSLRNESLDVVGHLPYGVFTGSAIWDGVNRTIHYFYGASALIYKIRIGEDGWVSGVDIQGGGANMMWASSCWDKVSRKAWIYGHGVHGAREYDFFEYELDTGLVTWLEGSSPGEKSDVTSMYDPTDGSIYFLGGYDWTLPDERATDTIYKFNTTSRESTLLSTRLTYKSDVAQGVSGNGGVYVFDTGYTTHKGLMKYTPGGGVHYMEVKHFIDYNAMRFGSAFVPKLNRIYMFGGNDESWWNHGSDRMQFVQIYSPI